MNLTKCYRHRGKPQKTTNGFSMVEVLIAGILLASSTAAVSRISVSALSSSANISQRARIEADINDNIQAMQMEDSYLTRDRIDEIYSNTWVIKNYPNIVSEESKQVLDAACHEIFSKTWIDENYPQNKKAENMKDFESGCDQIFSEASDKEDDSNSMNEKDDSSMNEENKQGLTAACVDAPLALAAHLENVAPEPRNKNVIREFDYWSIPGILRVVYRFEGPEQQVKSEQRLVEMSPNFASQCYTTR